MRQDEFRVIHDSIAGETEYTIPEWRAIPKGVLAFMMHQRAQWLSQLLMEVQKLSHEIAKLTTEKVIRDDDTLPG